MQLFVFTHSFVINDVLGSSKSGLAETRLAKLQSKISLNNNNYNNNNNNDDDNDCEAMEVEYMESEVLSDVSCTSNCCHSVNGRSTQD